MSIFQNFFNFFKILNIKNRLNKLNDIKDKSQGANSLVEDGVEFEVDYNSPKSQIDIEVENLINECDFNPKLIIEYIKSNGTPVHIFRLWGKILDKIGEHEGFITPNLGFKALWLNLMINHKVSFETEPMFVISKIPDDIYLLIYEFYKWYSYKKGLPGYDIKTQIIFKKVWLLEQDENIDKLGLKQVGNLQEAIKRDFEAISFAKRIAKEKLK